MTAALLTDKYELTMLLDGYPGQEHATPTVPFYQDLITLYARSGIAHSGPAWLAPIPTGKPLDPQGYIGPRGPNASDRTGQN